MERHLNYCMLSVVGAVLLGACGGSGTEPVVAEDGTAVDKTYVQDVSHRGFDILQDEGSGPGVEVGVADLALADADAAMADAELVEELYIPSGEEWESLAAAFPQVADDLLVSDSIQDGISDGEAGALTSLVQVLESLDDDELALAMPYLLTTPVPCRDDVAIVVDGDLSDWPDDAWLGAPTSTASLLGSVEGMAAATDGRYLWLAYELAAVQAGDYFLSVEVDTAWGAQSDFGIAMRLDVDDGLVYFWHVGTDGEAVGRNSGPIQGVRNGSIVEFGIPFKVLVPAERPVFRFSTYMTSSEFEGEVTIGRDLFVPRKPAPGALEDLLLLLEAVPEGIDDARCAVAVAIEDHYWTYYSGDVALKVIRGDSAAILNYALELPEWLAARGLEDHFSVLGLREKLHWAWRSGTGVAWAPGGHSPRGRRLPMSEEIYRLWSFNRTDLEWYRDWLLDMGALDGVSNAEELAFSADATVWAHQTYVTSPEALELQCEYGGWPVEFCESGGEEWYSEGLVLGMAEGEEIKLWDGAAPSVQEGVFEERGHFVGDCGTQTAISRAALRSLGLAAATFGYTPQDDPGPFHVAPVVFDPTTKRWFVPQGTEYLEPWVEDSARSDFYLPARHHFSYPTWHLVSPGVHGGDHVDLAIDTYADVVDLHGPGLSPEFIDSFWSDPVDLAGGGECSSEKMPDWILYELAFEYLTMPDGSKLETVVYLPLVDGPVPVLVHRSMFGWNEHTVERWVSQGYGFVAQWVRGRFGSDGPTCLFECAVDDGVATVDWVLEQEFSDGTIATLGGEYSAYTALAAATHPAVQAVVVENEAGLDIMRGWPGSQGRLLLGHFTSWLATLETGEWPSSEMWTELMNLTSLGDAAKVVGAEQLLFLDEYLEHFADPADSVWRTEHGLVHHLDSICAPVLHIGTVDWPYDGILDNYRALGEDACDGKGGKQTLAMGSRQMRGWFWGWEGEPDHGLDELIDGFLKQSLLGDTEAPGLGAIHFMPDAAQSWQVADSPDSLVEMKLYLVGNGDWGGTLEDSNTAETVWTVVVNDPAGQTDTCQAQINTLYFESALLDGDAVMVGSFAYSVEIKADTPDADLVVGLYEKDVADQYQLIGIGGSRLAFRDKGEFVGPLVAGAAMTVEGEVYVGAHHASAGSTLAVILSAQGCWFHENPNTGEPVGQETHQLAGTLKLGTGGSSTSSLTVSVLP